MISKLFKWALAMTCSLPLAAMAEVQMTNPVTGETETYENIFVGTSGEWDSSSNWTLKETDKVPFVSGGNYDSALVTGKVVSTETAIEGWTLRVGAYNGARVTWSGGITKIQAGTTGCWLTADETSVIIIDSFAGNQLEGSDTLPLKLSSAKDGGITWVGGITNATNTTLPFWYYLKDSGTVVYNGNITVANAQVIKQADITLSGTSKVASKTLVTFGSGTTATFTADAAIKIKDGDDVLKTVYLTSVTADTTTLTADSDVGACELVQTSTGIDLYYVDGDPADVVVEEKNYKPSININFTDSGNGLTTGADVGLTDYEVPGTSWNNFAGSNGTYGDVKAVADSAGSASVMSGVSVTVSGTRGSWATSLSPSSNPLAGYIDENAGNATPTVTVTGIPYYKYRVLVYHSTDTADVPFGYDTINGKNYTYVNDALAEGTTAWGNSGPDGSADAIAEGGNVLVTEAISGSTLTVVGHRAGGANNARGCIAAIQIIEVKPDVGENDLVIPVSGDTQYTVEETKELSGTVYLTGLGTLTLAGENKISAATIEISDGVTLVVNADRLDGTTFTGPGTVVYNGSQPDATKGFSASAWTGTVWVKNIGSAPAGETSNTAVTLGTDTANASDNTLKDWGNANSYVKFTNVRGHMAAATCAWTLVLEDGADTYAWYNNNGWTGRDITIAALEGDGTFYDQGNNGCRQNLTFTDASNFTGSFNISGKRIGLGGKNTAENSQTYRGTIEVVNGTTVTVASGKTWTTGMGFRVYGAINANGTLAADNSATACVRGSGTVTFGGVPSPTGDAWWKNAAWTGTVEIKGAAALNGDYVFNDYGNAGSTLKLTNCSGWLKTNYTCVPALEIGGTFTWNDGGSGLDKTFKVATLKGSGTISIPNRGAETAVWQITDDWSGFTGAVVGNNDGARRVLVFGSTLPASVVKGEIYISEGATLNLDNASSAWWGVGMRFVVDGTVKATNRSKWGGGTAMTIGDTGVLEITRSDSASADDGGTDYSNVTGTGTIKFSGSGFTVISQSIPTSLTFAAEKDSGSVVPVAGATIGSLTGSKGIRSDWGNNGSGGRYLTIKQSKDTSWDGLINVDGVHRLTGVIVDPLDSATGTLTLTATQTASSTLSVNGAVNLTGTWVGATTVVGTIGGTGTLTGDLTFSDGATFKAAATALTVSGTVALPAGEGESLTIDATGLTADEVTILSSSSITAETDVSKVTVNGPYTVEPDAGALKLVSTRVEVTVPEIANTTVAVAVGGETIGTASGTYKVAPDSVVTVTYAAAPGYEISGTTEYTIDTSKSETTFDPSGTTHVMQYVAYVVFQQESGLSYIDVTNYYTTVSNAIDAAKSLKKTVVLVAQPDAADTYAISVGETINVQKGEFTFDGIIFPEGPQYNNTTNVIAGVTQYKCTTYTATIQYPGEDPTGMTGELMQILGGLYSNYAPSLAGTVVTVLDGSDATIGDAMPDVFTYNSEAHTYTLKTMVAYYDNGYTKTYYPTLSDAVATVNSGLTITLAENVTLTESVEIAAGKSITIDLNGKTITGPAGGYAFSNAGEVTIENGTITGAGGVAENTADGASIAVSSGSYTTTSELFGNVEGGTIAVSGGTFNKDVTGYTADGYESKGNGDGTYTVSMAWIYAVPGYWERTGTWSEGATLGEDKVTIESNATYTASNPSAGQMVTVEMTLSFDAENDEDEDLGDVKTAVKIASGETEGSYAFKLYTTNELGRAWETATVGVTALTNVDYTFVFVLDLTNKTYKALLVDGVTTNAMSVGGSTDIPFASNENAVPVQRIDFIGGGSVASIKGSYEDAMGPAVFVEDESITFTDRNVQLSADQAAWLNKLGAKSAVAGALATLSSDQFSSAYLLNLDLTDTFTYEFTVSDITVGDSTVEVEVTLTRTGTLVDGEASINGTLKLMGGATLPASGFVDLHVAPVGDDDFSDGDTATWSFDKGSEKFFQPVIE